MSFITEALDKALKTFGTYHYEDKGAHEVMDVNALVQRLVLFSPEEVKELLDDLKSHEHGEVLYSSLWSALIEDDEYPLADELNVLLTSPFEGGPEPVEVEGLSFEQLTERLDPTREVGAPRRAPTTVDPEQRLNEAHDAFMDAGTRWQAASVELLEAKILDQFPTAKWAELTVVLDESYTEHSIKVFDAQHNELTATVDFPPNGDETWWMLASEGAVFAEGDTTTIHLSSAT